MLLLLALGLHKLRLHLLHPDLLLLLLVQVGHWLEAAAAGPCGHGAEGTWHGRLGLNGGWIDIDSVRFGLICIRCRILLCPQIDQVDELGAFDPGIVGVLVFWNISLRFCWFFLR